MIEIIVNGKKPGVLGKEKVSILDKFAWTCRLRKQKQKLTNLSRIEIILVILNERYQMFLSKGKQYEQFRQHGSLT